MTKRELINLCLALPDVYEDYPFDLVTDAPGAWTVMRHKESKKGFAHIFMWGESPCINLKCSPAESDLLRQSFSAITPAYHMNKEHWNSVIPDEGVPQDLVRALIQNSYELTKPKLKRKGI